MINKKVIGSRYLVFMEEKAIVDWEMENRPPSTDLSRVSVRPNQTSVDSIEVESEPVGKLNTQKNREPIEEEGESAERATEIDSNEEVKEEPTVPNGG